MLRKDLLDRLDLVTPALASNDLIPMLTHFAFTGETIMAFNDQIGASAPLQTQFVGGVPGNILLSLLKASKAKEVEFVDKNHELEIKAASSRFKLPVMPEDAFVFEMPKPTDKLLPVQLKPFADALDGCLRSVSSDTSVPDQLGVTLLLDGQDLRLFSTNNATLSTNVLALSGKPPFKERVILPTLFCQQVVKLSRAFKDCKLEIHDDYALLSAAKGVRCFGRFIHAPKPIDFLSIVSANLKDVGKRLAPIPSKLRLVVERAIIVTQSPVEQTLSEIKVKDGVMRFMSKSGRGEVTDSVQVDQDDAELALDPKHLKVGLASFYDPDEDKSGSMLMTDRTFIMSKGNDKYLVAAAGL
jgi:DNA polymerase III sliding clamp (beta) subunit (PCNA family)